MSDISYTFNVNEPNQPVLERSDVWRGLQAKARDATRFVRAMESCVVVEEFEGGLIRDIVIRGSQHRERVTFEPQRAVVFERIGGSTEGRIRNVIDGEGDDLTLTFEFDVRPKGLDADAEETIDLQSKIAAEYADAIRSTLTTIRAAKSATN